MLSLWQIVLVLGILIFLGFGPKLLGRLLKVKKGLKEGVTNFKSSVDNTDEKEVEGEVTQSKINKESQDSESNS